MPNQRSSASRAKPPNALAIDRPFDPAIWAAAEAIVPQYRVTMWFESGEFYGRGIELPGAGGDGPTPDACMASTRDSMTAVAAYMLECGEELPEPITKIEDEKFAAEEAARRKKPARSRRRQV